MRGKEKGEGERGGRGKERRGGVGVRKKGEGEGEGGGRRGREKGEQLMSIQAELGLIVAYSPIFARGYAMPDVKFIL